MTLRLGGILGGFLALAACKNHKDMSNSDPLALRLAPAGIIYPDAEKFSPSDVSRLLTAVKGSDALSVQSSATGYVKEPDLIPSVARPLDINILGYNQSRFLVDSRWATIRFLGGSPAGAGLEGDVQDKAQLDALGTSFDTIPVTTAAWTVTHIMNDYFVPLLESLPGGSDILTHFKVQGAYFSPSFQPPDIKSERDNAFMVGLQSLYLWPSSCFERGRAAGCKAPYLSTGHDPTVVGHEVAHAVFNHLRKGQSLDGFQWTAVNEGYADYFAAAYFSEPVLGRVWKSSSSTQPYLRAVNGNAQADDPKMIEEAHQYGTVWGGTLWRIRDRVSKELGVRPFEIDRVFLYGVTYLGETSKIRLGDAASSILKSAEILDATPFKKIMREEFEKAKISLAGNSLAGELVVESSVNAIAPGASENKKAANKSEGQAKGCGVLAAPERVSSPLLLFAPLVAALFLRRSRPRRES